MANGDDSGKTRFDWRMGIFVMAGWLGLGLIQWGTTSTQITDVTRRTELMERQLAERSIAREEYERRHEDLRLELVETKTELRELEKQVRQGK